MSPQVKCWEVHTGLSSEEYSSATWRLLNTGSAGVNSMAVDEALLMAVAGGKSQPALCFF